MLLDLGFERIVTFGSVVSELGIAVVTVLGLVLIVERDSVLEVVSCLPVVLLHCFCLGLIVDLDSQMLKSVDLGYVDIAGVCVAATLEHSPLLIVTPKCEVMLTRYDVVMIVLHVVMHVVIGSVVVVVHERGSRQ